MDEFLIGMAMIPDKLEDKTFCFLIKLMGYRNQLRINHWQTKSFAEHKLTDNIISDLDQIIDSIGEAALGAFGRPKLNTTSNNISDNALASTEYILKCINDGNLDLMKDYKESGEEGIFALLTDFDATIKKFIYLNTLN